MKWVQTRSPGKTQPGEYVDNYPFPRNRVTLSSTRLSQHFLVVPPLSVGESWNRRQIERFPCRSRFLPVTVSRVLFSNSSRSKRSDDCQELIRPRTCSVEARSPSVCGFKPQLSSLLNDRRHPLRPMPGPLD